MTKECVQVAVDTAFLSKLTEEDKKGVLFKNIMMQIDRSPVLHEFVYKEELHGNTYRPDGPISEYRSDGFS